MPIWLLDMSHTNNGDGDGWADQVGAGGALNSIVSALSGAAAADTIYPRGTGTEATADIALIGPAAPALPIKIIGVKAATTNTTPVQSDLIIGEATGGGVGVRAYDNTPPKIKITGSTSDIAWRNALYFYGINIEAGGRLWAGGATGSFDTSMFEECEFEWGLESAGSEFILSLERALNSFQHKNCKYTFPDTGSFLQHTGGSFRAEFLGMEIAGNNPSLLFNHGGNAGGDITVYGSDLTGGDNAFTAIGDDPEIGSFGVLSCLVDSGGTGFTPTKGSAEIYERGVGATQTKTEGESDQDFNIYRWNGDILNETTIVRTDGADDEADGGFSWAMTPHSGETEELFSPMVGPWIRGFVRGDGTNKTLTMYITNDSTAFNNAEVAIEVQFPSEDGNRKGGYIDTKMKLLGTPSALATDGSTWGGAGAGNGQKITAIIAPNFSGAVRARILYYRPGTDTLFLSPKMNIA